jgi:pimeloyl-ACP methyl ester carboxylesterase
MAEFVLVHGAWHGGWCWDELIPRLERLGHRARALDLPGAGADRTPAAEVTLEACARRVAEAVEAAPGKVWLVGHSMGGASITQAAEMVPDRLEGLVYVSAGLPLDGQSFLDAANGDGRDRVQEVMVVDPATGCGAIPPEHAPGCFYNLCSPAQVARAQAMLTQWQPLAPAATPVALSPARGGRVARFYVECLQDNAIGIATQRRMHAAAGVRGLATLDADHSPFWSRPDELAQALDGFVRG